MLDKNLIKKIAWEFGKFMGFYWLGMIITLFFSGIIIAINILHIINYYLGFSIGVLLFYFIGRKIWAIPSIQIELKKYLLMLGSGWLKGLEIAQGRIDLGEIRKKVGEGVNDVKKEVFENEQRRNTEREKGNTTG